MYGNGLVIQKKINQKDIIKIFEKNFYYIVK